MEKKIGNVHIIIKNKEGEYKTTTNPEGNFIVTGILPGLYHIEANAKAYDSYNHQIKIDSTTPKIFIQLFRQTNEIQNVEILGRSSKKYYSDYSLLLPRSLQIIRIFRFQSQLLVKN